MTEFGIIDYIKELFQAVPTNGFEGIGDDCAVLPIGNGESLVFTSDMLVEGVHFLRHATSATELGHKSLAVNLSDVASMGALPTASLLSISLPKDATGSWVEEFAQGYQALSAKYNVALVSGDTTASTSAIVINVTAIGRVKDCAIKRRSDALTGDVIFVSGELGESGMGLKDILAGNYDTPQARTHRNPTPQVAQGLWLGARNDVHAMMDISDGVASDIRHIMARSGVGAQIDTDKIPTKTDIGTALCAGEDYKLLFTADSPTAASLTEDFHKHFGTEIYPIGRIIEGDSLVWLQDGKPSEHHWQGYRHY